MRSILLAFLLVGSAIGRADTLRAPVETTYSSSDGAWTVTLTPARWALDEATEEYVLEVSAEAVLRRYGLEVARWRPAGDVTPDSALVATDGTVVTFNVPRRGDEGNEPVVFLFGSTGRLIQSWRLADLLVEEDVWDLRQTVTRIVWSGEHRLDEEAGQFVVQIAGPKQRHDLRFDLRDGRPAQEKRGLFPHLRATVGPAPSEASRCAGMEWLGGAELLARGIDVRPAAYPAIAKRARITGLVPIDVIVGEDGAVEWAAATTPWPFGVSDAAEQAARKWTFQPLLRDGKPVRVCARVGMNFGPMDPDQPGYE